MRIIATGLKGYVSGTLPTETWEITAEEWRRHCARTHPHPTHLAFDPK